MLLRDFSLREVGFIGEKIAKRFLVKQGCVIIDENYYTRSAEIDIIAKNNETLRFVEVKTQRVSCEMFSRETYLLENKLNPRKYKKMIYTASAYAEKYNTKNNTEINWQVDLCVVLIDLKKRKSTIKWYENYF